MWMWISILLSIFLAGCAMPTPDTSAAQLNAQLGLNYLQQGDVKRARAHLAEALQEDAASVFVLDANAYYAEVVGDLARAKFLYQRAIARNPASGMAHNNYGTYLCRHHQEPEGILQFLIAASMKNYLDVGEAYQNAGLCARLMNDNTLALHYFKLAQQYDPKLASF